MYRTHPLLHRDLLAQHQQLRVLQRRRTGQQHHPPGQANEHQVEHPYHHKPAILPAPGPPPQANPQVSNQAPFRNLTSLAYGKARGATIRRDLIDIAARTARHGRGRGRITLHLPAGWHREQEWMNLLAAACGPPAAAV